MAIKDGRCYPANGPQAEKLPKQPQNVSIIPAVTKSPYYDEQLYDPNITEQGLATVYIDGTQRYHVLNANKDNQRFVAYNGIATFDAITVTASGVSFENVTATNFVWYKASDSSFCTNCNNVRLLPRPNKRFFDCTGSPSFSGINARVLAPQCKCNFSDGSVTILRDRSSPLQIYTNVSVTDLTVSLAQYFLLITTSTHYPKRTQSQSYIEVFGPQYEIEYAGGFRDYYTEELKSTTQTLGIAVAIAVGALFVLHPSTIFQKQ